MGKPSGTRTPFKIGRDLPAAHAALLNIEDGKASECIATKRVTPGPDICLHRITVAEEAREYIERSKQKSRKTFIGYRTLEALLESCSRKSPKEIINAILQQVYTFANGQPQRDDETLLVARVEAGCDDLAVSAQPNGKFPHSMEIG